MHDPPATVRESSVEDAILAREEGERRQDDEEAAAVVVLLLLVISSRTDKSEARVNASGGSSHSPLDSGVQGGRTASPAATGLLIPRTRGDRCSRLLSSQPPLSCRCASGSAIRRTTHELRLSIFGIKGHTRRQEVQTERSCLRLRLRAPVTLER